jgi:FixJ family two-component response regulator
VILMTAYADVPMAIRALKAGVVEFIEKPFNAHVMLERIQRALAQDGERRASAATWEEFACGIAELTDKEKETLGLLLDGASNKVMAARLDISERAVEMRRASVMKKLQVNSLAELIRRVTQFELLFPQSKPIGRT